jgi:hypothetical protein
LGIGKLVISWRIKLTGGIGVRLDAVMVMKALAIFLLFISTCCFSQDVDRLELNEDARHFDFWEGTWYLLKDDNTIDTTTWFKVHRSVNPASFLEEWKFGSNNMKSAAIRAWDKTNNKWGFVWISDNGLYQVWDSKKVDGHWFIYRRFTVNGDSYLSRQGFLPQPDGTVLRVSEKTYDEKTWETRFRQRLKKSVMR